MERTLAGEALTTLILTTFRLNGVLIEAGNRITKPVGLTSARWQVMGAIEMAEQPLTVAQIARRMGLSRQAVQRLVNDLHDLDMIALAANPDHKRAPLVCLTTTGEKAMKTIHQAQASWVNQLAEELGERRINQAVQVLQAVIDRSAEFD